MLPNRLIWVGRIQIGGNMAKRNKNSQGFVTTMPMLFFFLAFFLLALRDLAWQSFVMAFAVPLVFYAVVAFLPRLLPLDRLLLSLVNFLCALGILMLYRMDPSLGFSQAVNYAVALVAMVLSLLLVRFWHRLKWTIPLIALGGVLLLFIPLVMGTEKNEVKAWLTLFGVGFQPSEIVKVMMLLAMASLLSRRKVLFSLILGGVYLLLLFLQKDLGTALIYYIIMLIMVFTATGSASLLGLGVAGAAGAGIVGYQMNNYVRNRVATWMDPLQDPYGSSHQVALSLVALVNGGAFGMGLGLGSFDMIPKLPEVSTDFIFSAIYNEFGILFGIGIVVLYLFIFLRGVGIALRSHSKFHTLLALGCACLVAVQTFIIIGGNLNIIPLTGVTLPFVSHGGTSLVSSMAIMGLLQGVANANERDIQSDQMIAMLGEDA